MISPTHSSDDKIDHEQVFPFVIHADTDRGQVKFCKNLLLNLFEPGSSSWKTEFPDIRIRRQILDHYVKDIAKITQQYGIYTIGISTLNDKKYIFQTDDLDLEFSKVFTEYIKNIQYHNSQRANSLFTNEVYAIIYTNKNILETTQTQSTSPLQATRHTRVRNEITAFSTFLYAIRENFSNNDVSQHSKHDLQKILAWFIIDYFKHNIDLISDARKHFRPQNNTDETVIHEQSDYVWDPDWSHPLFINFPTSISSQAMDTISIHRDYIKIIPLTIDATPLNYNSFLPDTQNNTLNSTFIQNENPSGTQNPTQQDIQIPSQFINEEIVQTTVTTTQQSISPIHPNFTTPKNNKVLSPQITLQSTVKPSATLAPKYSHMDYQTYRPMTRPQRPQRTFTRNNFAEHNYNYTHPPRTNYLPRKPNNKHIYSRNWERPITSNNPVNFQSNQRSTQDFSENYPFFQQKKISHKNPTIRNIYHPMMTIYQIFLNHIYKNTDIKSHNVLNIKEIFLKTH